MNETLTKEEIEKLEACQTSTEWKDACDAVKAARGGSYPSDWYAKVIAGGLGAKVTA